jgi:hypothetical protein
MPRFIVVTPHYGYSELKFTTDFGTRYAVYRFAKVTSAWTPINVAASESEAISKCKYLEITRGSKKK